MDGLSPVAFTSSLKADISIYVESIFTRLSAEGEIAAV